MMKIRLAFRPGQRVTILLILTLTFAAGASLLTGHKAAQAAPARGATPDAAPRIVAIADVHGAFQEFLGILQRVGLIDAGQHWAGGATVFVQVGDIPDRGPETRKALDLMMQLEREAPAQSGKVIPLLGNHEVMQMMGDLRYTTPADFQSFATDQSDKVRDAAYQDYRKFVAATRSIHDVPDDEDARQKWLARHPLGFFEQRDAYAPDGAYGRWLRSHDAIAQLGDTIFLHAGLDPGLRFKSVDELNGKIRSEIGAFDKLWKTAVQQQVVWRYMTLDDALAQARLTANAGQSGVAVETARRLLDLPNGLLMADHSPLWYRGLALEAEDKNEKGLNKMLSRLDAGHIVIGHTVLPAHVVTARFDNRVFLIDTGMNKSYYNGRASALEIRDGKFTAYYADDPNAHVLVGGSSVTDAAGR